jgi:hypothetical protein
VNKQIIDAVTQSTSFALGLQPTGDLAKVSAGASIAYDKAVQAAAFAVQDAADYQRNVLSISTAVQGKAMAMILADPANLEGPVIAWALAVASSIVAPIAAGEAAANITKAIQNFPPN